ETVTPALRVTRFRFDCQQFRFYGFHVGIARHSLDHRGMIEILGGCRYKIDEAAIAAPADEIMGIGAAAEFGAGNAGIVPVTLVTDAMDGLASFEPEAEGENNDLEGLCTQAICRLVENREF